MENWETPNEYAGSNIQQTMVKIAEGFPEKEQSVITARGLAGGGTYDNPSADGIAGQGVPEQMVWVLSKGEWEAIKGTGNENNAIIQHDNAYWLRTGHESYKLLAWFGMHSQAGLNYRNVSTSTASGIVARPALSLDLSVVFFTSAASETSGKSAATAGAGLFSAQALGGTVKFTMKDSRQTLAVNATKAQSQQQAQTLEFSYTGATTGTNQYISCILTDSTGAVKYYGKLADSSNAESGNLTIPLSGIADGTYTLQIFSEEANGALYTDFCSEPVTMKVSVSSGTGTVSKFGGTILHEHSWDAVWSHDKTGHWHECTASGCPITDNSQKDGYAAHIYDQKVVDDTYKASEATCTEPEKYYYSCICGAKGSETFASGEAAGHTWSDWVSNGDGTHSRTCSQCQETERKDCSGGTATCAEKAVCESCGAEYGEVNPSNHTNLVKTEATPATQSEAGNIEYWYCDGCGKYFSNAAGTKEISKEDTAIPVLTEHTGDVQTGDDSNITPWIAVMLASGIVLMVTAFYNRKKKYSR